MLDEETLKKLFYYCLKRTGNREQAEDLSGDISLEILAMLNRGYKAENFNAWMWTVAKAKYAGWAKSKNISSKNIINADISDNENLSSYENIENDILHREDLYLLRRELAIMSREYREITVAYYIDNQKISDISKTVKLPEGTIKRKLSESRNYLKEGINMTRTYGKRSYAPENISFTIDRVNPIDNVPYSLIGSKLAKNILLEAYTAPCTTEELSISLGVASPYLEEEQDKLVEGLLLAKIKNNKYETDFIIIDRDTQKKIFDLTLETAEKICEPLTYYAGMKANTLILIDKMDMIYAEEQKSMFAKKYTAKFKDEFPEAKLELNDEQKVLIREQYKKRIEQWKTDFGNHTTGGAISIDLTLWFNIFKSLRDMILTTEINKGISRGYPKEYKGQWSITGFEDYTNHEILKYSVGMDWENNAKKMDKHLFKFHFTSLGLSQTKPNLNDIGLFADILKNNKKFNDLSENEKDIAAELVEKDIAVIENDYLRPAFPIYFTSGLEKLDNYLLDAVLPEELKTIMAKSANSENEIIKKCEEICHREIFDLFEYNLAQIKIGLPERLHEQAKYCARNMLFYLRNAVLKYAVEKKYLPVTDKPVGIGAYVVT